MIAKNIAFTPLEGYCLCDAPGNITTEGGIVIPETNMRDRVDSEPIRLHVVKVGPGEQMDAGRRREVVVEAGKTYYFVFPSYNRSAELTLGGVKYLVVESKFVCGEAV